MPVAQRGGQRFADGLNGDFRDFLAAHARFADDDLASDVPDDEALGQVEQPNHGSSFAMHDGNLRFRVSAEEAELHPGPEVAALAERSSVTL